MTAPVESALEHWHKLLSIAHERKHHLDEGLVAIEARDAAVRKAAWREAMGALQLIEVDLEAGDLPARDRVAMALARTKAWLKHFAAKAKEPT